MKSLRNASLSNGGESARAHSRPMLESDMKKVYDYIMSICPGEQRKPYNPKSKSDKKLRLWCLYYLAFSTSAFTLWTRCVSCLGCCPMLIVFASRTSETLRIRYMHLQFDLETQAPIPIAYFTVNLVDRKGWQKKMATNADAVRRGMQITYTQQPPHFDYSQATHIIYMHRPTHRISIWTITSRNGLTF
jgi:hypothetical protein